MKRFSLTRIVPVIVALLAMLVLMVPAPAQAQGAVVSIPDATAGPGEEVTLAINITDITDVGAINIWLSYDSSIVTIPGGGIAAGDMGALAASSIDNTSGIAKMVWFNAEGKTGDFVFANVTLKAGATTGSCPLDIQVQELTDTSYELIPYTEDDGVFAVDATPPTVTALTPSPVLLTDAQFGAGNFTVTIDYSETMDTGVAPTITFGPPVGSTLTFSSGGWSDSDTYAATYDVADAGVDVAGVDVGVSGAEDAAGNTQDAYSAIDAFDIDTLNPTVSIDVSEPLIDEAHAGSTFDVIATFSETMDGGVTPTCTLTPDVSSSLTSPTGTWSGGNTVYTFSYTVVDANVEMADVDVSIGGGKDANGNTQSPDPTTATDKFDIDTLAPTVVGTSPEDGAVAVALNAAVNATFSEGIQEGDNSGAIAISPDPGGVSAGVAGSVLSIAHNDFGYLTVYSVTIPSGAIEDTAGNPNAEYSWSFTTLPSLMEGDVSLNNQVQISDAMLIAQHMVGLVTLTDDQLICADTIDDGTVTMADAMHIAQWLVDPEGTQDVLNKPLWEEANDLGITVPPQP
jgi:hypothetical protein